jgi:O-acetylserine/cysteine efflux transporter
MLWMTVVPPVPMLALSLALEGPDRIGASLTTLGTTRGVLALAGLGFTVLAATLVGTGLWTALMSRHPSSTVAPFSMLVPVVGIATSAAVLGEPTAVVELAAGAVVLAGVLLSTRPSRRGRPARWSRLPTVQPGTGAGAGSAPRNHARAVTTS